MEEEILGPQKLGPLTPLVGEWEGNVGIDLSYHNKDDVTRKTRYFEKAIFKPIPIQENGQQQIEGLFYKDTAWRHGEEAMDPFHDEVGFLLWDKKNEQVLRTVVFGRGIAIQAGASAKARDKVNQLHGHGRGSELWHPTEQAPHGARTAPKLHQHVQIQ